MVLRPILCFVLLSMSVVGTAQDAHWSLGTDPSLWLGGWRNVQVGSQLTPELGVVGGVGWMRGNQGAAGTVMRGRPADYDQALLANLGVRLYPGGEEGRTVQGLVGLEYSYEWYTGGTLVPNGSDAGRLPGRKEFSRSDLRLLAGGRVVLSSAFTLSAHAGIGYAFRPDSDWIGAGATTAAPSMARLVGMELMWWL